MTTTPFKKMIVAAANKYLVYDKDGNLLNQICLVDNCHGGRNMQTTIHMLRAAGLTVKPRTDEKDRGQGFIDECGLFHNRSEAYKIAKSSGQPFNDRYTLPNNKLDSSCIRHFDEGVDLKDYMEDCDV